MAFKSPLSILSVAVLVTLVGCAAPIPIKTYDGQQLPVADTAALLVDRQIFVSEIAGYRTGIKFTTKEESKEGTQFDVKPGVHKIVFSYYSRTSSSDNVGLPPPGTRVTTTYRSASSGPIEITYDFQKGHKYEVHYRPDNKKFHAQIVDVTSGASKRGYAVAWGQL